MQSALSTGPSASVGLEGLVASELTFEAAGIGGQVEMLSSNLAMLRAMRDAMDLDVNAARAMNSVGESGGMQLPEEHLERFERAFDRDLGHVRIHADGRAAEAAVAIQAYAFALGAHIFFGPGTFAPGTRQGDRLIAHELTHVIQSDQGRLPSAPSGEGLNVSSPTDPHEVEAYANEARMLDRLTMVDRALDNEARAEAADAISPTSQTSASGVDIASGPSIDTAADSAASSLDVGDIGGIGIGSDVGATTSVAELGSTSDIGVSDAAADTAMRDAEHEAVDTNAASAHIRSSRGGALPSAVAQKMAGLLGHDFSHVRIHTDQAAAQASDALGARAFALGSDLFFSSGEYAPGSRDGDRLLAHELTHVVQSDEGRLGGGGSSDLDVSSPSDSTEREAEAAESLVDSGMSMSSAAESSVSAFSAPAMQSDSGLDAGAVEGVAHRTSDPETAANAGGVADEYVFTIGGLERKMKPKGDAKAGADVVFNLDWNVCPGVNLGRAVVHLDNEGKIEYGTVKGTFAAGNYISAGEMNLQIGKEGAIDAKVTGKYDLGWIAGDFEGTIDRGGLTIRVDLAVTKPIADNKGRFNVGSVSGSLTMGTDGKWAASGEVQGEWKGIGTARIKIKAENDHLSGEVDFNIQPFNVGENVKIGPAEIKGKYDSVEGIKLGGKIHIEVGDFEADLEGTLELDAEGGIVGASGGASSNGVAPNLPEGAGESPAGPGAQGQGQGNQAAQGQGGGNAPAGNAGGGGESGSGGGSGSGSGGGRSRRGRGGRDAGGGSGSGGGSGGGTAQQAPAGPGGGAGGEGGGAGAAPGGAGSGSGSGGGRRKKRGGSDQGGEQAAAPVAKKVPVVPNKALLPNGGKLNLPEGTVVGGKATLRQKKEIDVDGFKINNGEISIGLEENTFTKVSTNFDYNFDKYSGHIDATVDVATGMVQGKGTCKLDQEIPIGDTGAVITKANGELTIVDSKPTTLKGEVSIDVPYKGEKTFVVTGSDLVFDFEKQEASGNVTATLIRELTFGSPDKVRAVIAEGASATAVVEANKLKSIDGGLDYTVLEPQGELGKGKIVVKFTPEGSVDATADFALTCEYGLPEREKGPVWLKKGSGFKVTMTGGELEKAETVDVKFEFVNPTGEGGVEGDLQGVYTFKDKKVDATGHAEIVIPWTIRGDKWGFVTFTKGGSLDASIKKSELEKLEGLFPYTAKINAGDKILDLEGELKGKYDKKKDKFSGELNGTLKNELEFALEGGARLKVVEGATAKIDVKDSDLNKVELNFDCLYYKAGESDAFLGGKIEKAQYDLKTGEIRFDGTCTLLQNVEKKTEDGKWTLRALKDSKCTVEVRKSALTKIGGDIKFEVDDTKEKLLEGDLKGLELDVQTFKMSGNLDVRLARDLNWPHKEGETKDVAAYRLNVKKGSHITGRVEKNAMAEVGAELDFSVDFLQITEAIQGNVKGKWDFSSDEFTGGAEIEVKKPFPLVGGEKKDAAGKQLESFLIGVLPGSKVTLDVKANVLQRATVNLDTVMEYNNEDVATGKLNGQYKIGDEEKGFSGKAVVDVTKRFEWAEGSGDYSYKIEQGTRAEADMAQSKITSAKGKFILVGNSKSRKRDEWKVEAGGDWAPSTGVNGDGRIEILEDIVIGTGSTYTAVLCKKSEAVGYIENDNFKKAVGNVDIRLDEGTTQKILGKLNVTYEAGSNTKVSGQGTLETLDDFKIGGLGDFKFILAAHSIAKGSVKDNDLEWIDGDVTVNVNRGESAFGVAKLNGKYTHGATPEFSGKGTFDVLAPETDLGISLPGDMRVYLLAGAGMKAVVSKNDLEELSSGVPLLVKKAGQPFIDVKLDGTYFHKTKKFTGRAMGRLIPRMQVGKPVGEYTFFVDPSTGVVADFNEKGIQQLSGTLKTSVEDKQGLFLTAEGQATWVFGAGGDDGKLTADGTVLVKRTKVLGGEGAEWTVKIKEGSGGEVHVKDSELTAISGNITILVDKASKPFGEVTFSEGGWKKGEGFSGKGAAKLTVGEQNPYEMATLGNFKFTLLDGSGGNIVVEHDKVTHIDGIIKIGIDKGVEKFMAGELKGDYDFAKKEFNGGGSISVINEQHLASVGDAEHLWLIPGSGVEVHITKNDLDKVGGQLTLSLRDTSEYLTCALKGSYDIKGGTGFTGDGAINITRKKQLFASESGYKFSLDVGTGAKAWIVKNQITEVKGQIPFVVEDKEGPLLEGKAEGDYKAATGKYNGEGVIKLARDVTYKVGSDLELKFKKGSGGQGKVTDSKLEKLGGTLEVELWKGGKGIVSVKAEGEYDAVRNVITKLKGEARLLQPIELLDGNVIISDLKGEGEIRDNKLVSASGEGAVKLPKVGDGVKGTFKLSWSNLTGKDVYEGSGKLEFGLFNDATKGRKMTGEVDATYRSDDTFDLHGKVRYDMNEMIGGEVDVTMDQTFNPSIDAQMEVKGTLVEARDLFKIEKDIVPPVPVVLFPGVNLVFGVRGGLAMKMRALTFQTVIGIQKWKPKEGNVPDFNANLDMNWGFDFDAMLAAYAKLTAGIPGIADVGAGIRGQVDLHAPLEIKPFARIHGGKDTFGGELGVGISLKPTVKLSIIPFVEATVLDKRYGHDFDGAEMNLGEIFKFEWGTSYKFGDENKREKKAPTPQAVPAPTVDTTKRLNDAPSLGGNSAGGAPTAKKGAPQIESGADVAKEQEMAKSKGDPKTKGEMEEKMETIKIVGEGLGALGYLMDLLMGVLTALTFGPIGLGLYLVYAYFFKDFSFKKVGEAIKKLMRAISKLAEILEPMMPDWLKSLAKVIADPPGLLDLFTGDDKARAETRSGKVFTDPDLAAKPAERGKLHAEMVYQMLDGWTGEDDQECILICLQRGDVGAILNRVSVGWILDDLDGYEDTEARKIFRSRGIQC